MTAPSPVQLSGALVSFTITANGSALDSSWQVVSIDVWHGVNKLPKARLVITDGDAATGTFPISESSTLIPGATLTIGLGYDGSETTVFSGIIYRQGLEIGENTASRLVVEATDKAMAMTLARGNAIYENITDSALITKLITGAGLTASVTATSATQPTVVQYYASAWDLMVIRAQLNGMMVMADAGKVTVAPPDTSQSPVLTVTFGDSILDFQADMDAATQYSASAIQSYAWDPATQALAKSGAAATSVSAPGNISSADLAKVFGITQFLQQTGGTLGTADLTAWSSADLTKNTLAKNRGQVSFQGSALAKTGAMITLAGLGGRFNGDYVIGAVHHSVTGGFWRTTVEAGLSPDWFSATTPDIPAPGASGQLPPGPNLQTGLVQKIATDPDGEFRVYVTLPLLQAQGSLGVWARLGSFYAYNGIGAEFYPEVGSEVVVAFMNGDPRFAVIVGSLYSKKNPPPVTPAAENNQKSIVTRAKLRLDFFEDKKAVEISTPGGQSVRLDDDAKSITVKDMNGNTVTLDGSGVTVKSKSNISLSAGGNVTVSADGNLSLSANGTVSVKGATIKQTADASFSAQGSAEAKLTSSGIVTVQGALVKIN
ncbi:Rhs element Vgr protein [Azospirillum fermentarium]|uniref:type VI secretion system tip protein VgrG n=1 Tax=Azospirillum fermentarium TaxID=1233114 RepID=UPI002227E05F|nr:type VI secretion system tip protein VgrG [Azospirillum fermentarium]MCW2247936.1 Rhs element Vgr protein [Azospirillum fermentarium]